MPVGVPNIHKRNKNVPCLKEVSNLNILEHPRKYIRKKATKNKGILPGVLSSNHGDFFPEACPIDKVLALVAASPTMSR